MKKSDKFGLKATSISLLLYVWVCSLDAFLSTWDSPPFSADMASMCTTCLFGSLISFIHMQLQMNNPQTYNKSTSDDTSSTAKLPFYVVQFELYI